MRNNFGVDQADGLRRLLVSNQTQVIALAAGKSGVGRTCVAINMAAGLANVGRDVLVLDENASPNNVSGRMGLHVRHDLLDVVQGRCKLGDAVLSAGGFSVLSIARAMSMLTKLNHNERQGVQNALTEAGGGADVVLVDALLPAFGQVHGVSGQAAVSLGITSGEVLVVVDATASGITESYASIKRMAVENARLQFEIIINKVADDQAARIVFENMAKLARRNLAARLDYLGSVPLDDSLKRASRLGKSVIEAYPSAPSARSFMGLAQKLLLLPLRQDQTQGAMHTVMRDLMMQASQPLQRSSRESVQVVN